MSIENEMACTFSSVIDCLERATETEWTIEHTGGGCFWLITYFGGHYGPRYFERPMLCVTFADGPFGSDAEPSMADTEGYMIGGYLNSDERPEGDFLAECSVEELPLKVRQVHQQMMEEANGSH